MPQYTVVGIYPDGEPLTEDHQALESYVEIVEAASPKAAAKRVVSAVEGRDVEYVIAVFEGDHYDVGPCTEAYDKKAGTTYGN